MSRLFTVARLWLLNFVQFLLDHPVYKKLDAHWQKYSVLNSFQADVRTRVITSLGRCACMYLCILMLDVQLSLTRHDQVSETSHVAHRLSDTVRLCTGQTRDGAVCEDVII